MNNHSQVFEKLYDETTRVEKVIYLAGAMASGDSFSDDLREFFEEEDEDAIESCFGPIPDGVELDEPEFVYEWLVDAQKFGFLVQVATPVMKPLGDGCTQFSWGHYRTEWVYGETLDSAIRLGLAWVAEMRELENTKFQKGAQP